MSVETNAPVDGAINFKSPIPSYPEEKISATKEEIIKRNRERGHAAHGVVITGERFPATSVANAREKQTDEDTDSSREVPLRTVADFTEQTMFEEGSFQLTPLGLSISHISYWEKSIRDGAHNADELSERSRQVKEEIGARNIDTGVLKNAFREAFASREIAFFGKSSEQLAEERSAVQDGEKRQENVDPKSFDESTRQSGIVDIYSSNVNLRDELGQAGD